MNKCSNCGMEFDSRHEGKKFTCPKCEDFEDNGFEKSMSVLEEKLAQQPKLDIDFKYPYIKY